jgi:hypothetical protein
MAQFGGLSQSDQGSSFDTWMILLAASVGARRSGGSVALCLSGSR